MKMQEINISKIKRFIFFIIIILFQIEVVEAEVLSQSVLGDFKSGKMDRISLSVKPNEEYMDIRKASIKLSSQYPIWDRDPFLPSLDPSGSPAFADLDNDGDFDLLLGGGKKIYAFKNEGSKYIPKWVRFPDWDLELSHEGYDLDLIDFDYDGDDDIFITPNYYGLYWGTQESSIFAYENIGSIYNPQWQRKSGWEPPKVVGWANPVLGDIDGDGDMDIILAGDDNGRSYVYENKEVSHSGTITWQQREDWEPATFTTPHGGYTSINLIDIDGDGDLDLCRGGTDYVGIIINKGSRENPKWEDKYGSIKCFIREGIYLDYAWTSHMLMANSVCVDIDSDGDYDIYLLDSYGWIIFFFENIGSKNSPLFKYKIEDDTPFMGTGIIGLDLADIDFDTDYDLFLGEGPSTCGKVRFIAYENTDLPYGFIWKRRVDWDPLPDEYESEIDKPGIPRFVDIDNDNDFDIYLDGGILGSHPKGLFYENIGSIYSPSWKRNAIYDLPPTGAFPVFVDLDSDGDYDAMVGENTLAGSIIGFENQGSESTPKWVKKEEWNISNFTPYPIPNFADLDSDGDYDLLIGNIGTITFWENIGSPQSPSWKENFSWSKLYLSDVKIEYSPLFVDFDNDGDYDLYLGNSSGNAVLITNIGPHFPCGTFTSAVFGSSTAVLDWDKIFWYEKKPTNTSIKIQIRTGNTQVPDNSWSNWTSVSNGSEIPTNSKYIQYRAILETKELEKSPVLYEVRITYQTKQNKISVYPSSGPVGSKVTVVGVGFGANEQIQIDFGKRLSITFATTNQAGTFTAIFTVNAQPEGITSVTAGGLNSKLTAADYFIITAYSYIKGYIRDGGEGIEGVVITLSGDSSATYTTTSNGYYEFIELLTGTYTVTPTLSGYAFIPSSRTYQPLTSNMDNQDFIGIKGKISILPGSGTVDSWVKVLGSAFLPTEPVRLKFGNITIGTFTTNFAGTFSAMFTVPLTSEGTTTITAFGLNSGLEPRDYFYVKFELAFFRIAPISTPQSAGVPFDITITAIDNTGGTLTNFSAAAMLTDVSDTILPKTTTNFTAGIWQGTVTITKAGTTSITANYAGKIGTSNPFYVQAGTPTKILVYPKEEVSIPAGGTSAITGQITDAYDNPVGSAGITCNVGVVVIAGTSGILSAATTTTNQSGQIATITYSVSTNAGDKAKILLSTLYPLLSTYSATITTIPADLHHFTFDPIATQTAGANFQIRITAKDRYENTIGSFDGTTTLTDLTNSLNPKQTPVFVAGSWTGSGSITVAGTTNITADYGNIRGTSNTFFVTSAGIDHFVIGTITNQTAGVAFTITYFEPIVIPTFSLVT